MEKTLPDTDCPMRWSNICLSSRRGGLMLLIYQLRVLRHHRRGDSNVDDDDDSLHGCICGSSRPVLECDCVLVGPIPSCPPIEPCPRTNSMPGCAEVKRCAEPGYVGWSIKRIPFGWCPRCVVLWRGRERNTKVAGKYGWGMRFEWAFSAPGQGRVLVIGSRRNAEHKSDVKKKRGSSVYR